VVENKCNRNGVPVEIVQIRLDTQALESPPDLRDAHDDRVQAISMSSLEKAAWNRNGKTLKNRIVVQTDRFCRATKTEEAADGWLIPAGIIDQPDGRNAIDAATSPPNGLQIPLKAECEFAEFVAVD
jgi:hypothetical protein